MSDIRYRKLITGGRTKLSHTLMCQYFGIINIKRKKGLYTKKIYGLKEFANIKRTQRRIKKREGSIT